MRFDFSNVDDVHSFVSVPAGLHAVRVAEVREGRSRDGSTRWTFRLEVLDGDHAGRTAAWDSLTWSERGIYRVKKVLAALGLDVSGEVEVESKDLVGLRVNVLVQPEEREDPVTGQRQVRMRVPYLGYEPLVDGPRPEITGSAEPDVDGWDDADDSDGHDSTGGRTTGSHDTAGSQATTGSHDTAGRNGRANRSDGAPF